MYHVTNGKAMNHLRGFFNFLEKKKVIHIYREACR